jgi:hypothetical protein
MDIADECAQGKGDHFPDAAETDDGQQLRVAIMSQPPSIAAAGSC